MDPQFFHTGVGAAPIIDKVYDIKLCLTFAVKSPPDAVLSTKSLELCLHFSEPKGRIVL